MIIPFTAWGGTSSSSNMLRVLTGRIVALLVRRRALVPLAAVALVMLAPGMRGRLFGTRSETDQPRPSGGSPAAPAGAPASLVHLKPGCRFAGDMPPEGWTHLVIKSVPKLSTGDLDTVSAQAFETAGRVRPVIVADVRRSSAAPGSPFALARVGVGLCAPASEPGCDVVVSATSVNDTKGPWSAKQRLILAAMALETAEAKLVAATPTFAFLRTPVTFLIGGSHRKIDVCYVLLVDPGRGGLQTLVWVDRSEQGAESPPRIVARRFNAQVFDSPLDVKANKIFGDIPVTWSFAIRELPPGVDLTLPEHLSALLSSTTEAQSRAAEIERALTAFLEPGAPGAGLARGDR